MDFDVWQKLIEEALRKAKTNSDYLSLATHGFRDKEDYSLLVELEEKLGISLPDEFKSFYERWGELQLIDVMNGYHILKISFILESFEYTPTKHKDFEQSLLVFGANGGGNLFAIELKQGRILFLPDPFVNNNAFGTLEPIRIVAYSFNDFLQRVLQDIQAFVTGNNEHLYLDRLDLK